MWFSLDLVSPRLIMFAKYSTKEMISKFISNLKEFRKISKCSGEKLSAVEINVLDRTI